MKTKRLFATAVLPVLLACGCSSLNNTENGALAGGALGAGTGALIGHATGHTGAGALIGAGVGALSGGLIGHAVDNSEKKAEAQAVAAQQQHTLGLIDIVQMVQSHVSDDVIIAQIRSTRAVFYLSSQDTIYLKQNGVSDVVVQEMMATAYRYPRRVYTTAPAYSESVYVVEPAPVVGVGFGYSSCGRWR
jgi:outer membrane lipoprotein SlyB